MPKYKAIRKKKTTKKIVKPKVLGPKPKAPKKPNHTEMITVDEWHDRINPYIKELLEDIPNFFKDIKEVDWKEFEYENKSVEALLIMRKNHDWDESNKEFHKNMYEFLSKWEEKIPGIEGTKKLGVTFIDWDYMVAVNYSAKVYKPLEQVAEESQKYEKAYAAYKTKLAEWEKWKAEGVKTEEEVKAEKKLANLKAKRARLEQELKKVEQELC